MSRFHRLLLFQALCSVVGLCLLVSCHKRPVYDCFQSVNPTCWGSTDTLRFTLDDLPNDTLYTFSLGVRSTEQLSYQELWLVMEARTADGCRHRDTIHIDCVERQDTWQSQSILHEQGSGFITHRITKEQMPIEVLVYHIMRDQRLRGILDVGLKIQ